MTNKRALIMVDLQIDFCEGGSLAVKGANEIIPIANQLQPYFELVIATKDWHPPNHISFAANHQNKKIGEVIVMENNRQVLWPEHCVQETKGAEFHPMLDTSRIKKIFYKGTDTSVDSYSAFFDNAHLRSTGLEIYLKEQGIKEIYVMGLATDYCVKYTSLDGLQLNFDVIVIADACRGVNLNENDVLQAFEEMRYKGVEISCTKSILV